MAGLSRLALMLACVLVHPGDGTPTPAPTVTTSPTTLFGDVLCGATTAVWNPRLTTSSAADLSVTLSNNWVPNTAASAGDGTVAQALNRQDLVDGTTTLQVNALLAGEPQMLEVDDRAYNKERINIASLFMTGSSSARSTMSFKANSGMKFNTKIKSSSVGFCDDVRLDMLIGSPTQTPTPVPTPLPTSIPSPLPTPSPTQSPTPVPSTAAPTETPEWDGVLCGATTAVWNPRLTASSAADLSVAVSNNWVPNAATSAGDGTVAQTLTEQDLLDGTTTLHVNTLVAEEPQMLVVDDRAYNKERIKIASLFMTSSHSTRSTMAFKAGSGIKFSTKTENSSVGFCDDVRKAMLLGSPTETPTPVPTPPPTSIPSPLPTSSPTQSPTPVPSTAAPTTTPVFNDILCGATTAVWNPRLTTSSLRVAGSWVPNAAVNAVDGTSAQKLTPGDLLDGSSTLQVNTILTCTQSQGSFCAPVRLEVDDSSRQERIHIASLFVTSSPSTRSTFAFDVNSGMKFSTKNAKTAANSSVGFCDDIRLDELQSGPSLAPTFFPTPLPTPMPSNPTSLPSPIPSLSPTSFPTPPPTWAAWETLPPIPVTRRSTCYGASVANIGGYDMVVCGGRDSGSDSGETDVYGYTASTYNWTKLAPLPASTYYATCIAYKNELFVLGGYGTSGLSVEAYIFDGMSWSDLPPLTIASSKGMMGAVGSTLFIAGGVADDSVQMGAGSEKVDSSMLAYDIATSTYDQTLPSMPYARYGGVGVTVDSTVYIFGGSSPNSPFGASSAETYTVSTSTWAQLPSMPVAAPAFYCVGAYIEDDGSIFAGTLSGSYPYEYDIAASLWSDPLLPSFNHSSDSTIAHGLGSHGFTGSMLYYAGGGSGSTSTDGFSSIKLHTPGPSPRPSVPPTAAPTPGPSALPTSVPTRSPTPYPSYPPTPSPSVPPTPAPSSSPTSLPSPLPSALPTPAPSSSPTSLPSPLPSALPTPVPTFLPTPSPTPTPTPAPSYDCPGDTFIYRLRMLDTGGDGWQSATYKLYNSTSFADSLEGTVVASGTLGDGFEGSDWICLADGCHEIVVGGGSADSEIGFEFYDEVRGEIVALPSRHLTDVIVMYVDLLSCIARGSTGRRPLSRPQRTVLGPPLRHAGRCV